MTWFRCFSGYLDFYEVPAPHAKIREFLGARIGSGQSTVFIARSIDGLAVGFVQHNTPFFASLALQASWLVSDLYVLPAARRDGYGEALMNAARAHGEHRCLRPDAGDGEG